MILKSITCQSGSDKCKNYSEDYKKSPLSLVISPLQACLIISDNARKRRRTKDERQRTKYK